MLKNESKDTKIKLLKKYLTENVEDVENIIAFNIFLLIKGNHCFSNDFFNNENVLFVDTSEYIDIKDEINKELTSFIEKLLNIYINCFTHCALYDETNIVKMPEIYKKVLLLLDFQTINKLFKNFKPQQTDCVYEDSYDVVYALSKQFVNYIDLITEDSLNYGNRTE